MIDRYSLNPPQPPEGVDWKDMASAPHDGTVIAVRFHLFNRPDMDEGVQVAQWLDGEWRTPLVLGSKVYADAWAPVEEVRKALCQTN